MLDFINILVSKPTRSSPGYIYPDFVCSRCEDLMVKGHDFYAIYDADRRIWSTNEDDVTRLIDRELRKFKSEHSEYADYQIKFMNSSSSGTKQAWRNYVTKLVSDNYIPLDSELRFSDDPLGREAYASKTLPYMMRPGDIGGYDELMSTLYSPEDRHKIEWAIGSVFAGASKTLQKFFVLYGAMGTGKSTVLNIIQQLFEGYWQPFDASLLAVRGESFPLEQFKDNPLVAIQHDGDLSRIEDNTRLNSIVSHEKMTVNEKFKSRYSMTVQSLLFMGTNSPVRITDAKSGILRRLVDIKPSGMRLSRSKYDRCVRKIPFELGAIAARCKGIYLEDPNFYDDYSPLEMMSTTNDFYNFILENIDKLDNDQDYISSKAAWELYKEFAEYANITYKLPLRAFKNELKNYYDVYLEQATIGGAHINCVYRGFKKKKLSHDVVGESSKQSEQIVESKAPEWLRLRKSESPAMNVFNVSYRDEPAQYATLSGTPSKKWSEVTTCVCDLDTTKIHYVRMPENHICIDFDLKDENGEKSLTKNLEAASKFPKTYAEVSKGGGGLHLHYIYDGDASKLSAVYDDNIEVKVFKGNSSLRRRLSLCNGEKIAHISSGLPLKGADSKVIDWENVKNEKALRTMVRRSLGKEYLGATKPEMDFIKKYTDDAYESGLQYDIRDLRPSVMNFAAASTNNAQYCMELVEQIHWCSDDEPEDEVGAEMHARGELDDDSDIIFFDVEVFPNLFLVCWKKHGGGDVDTVVRMINPSPAEIEELCKHKLVGFNNRKYDNHILMGRIMGYSEWELYLLSQRIIENSRNAGFKEASKISYTDIYDFAATKQSLKKWEIELGIHHMELGLPWDQPVDPSLWERVAEYCANDVMATEAVFNKLAGDFAARKILAKIAGMSPNDTTNQLTTRIIFGRNRNPRLVYTDLATGEMSDGGNTGVINSFPGYIYESGAVTGGKARNMYRGVNLGFGGFVFATPGYWTNVALLDVRSMHPSSAINMNYFGEYTKRFEELVMARAYIKHRELDKARAVLDGVLAPFLPDDVSDEVLDQLSLALKIAINSVYGLTSASFENAFKDSRNVNNIVALRGALFMKTLQDEVEARGFVVAHIKTDSIKIPNATPEIISFCMEFAKKYGYEFEHEATYEKMCLVNDAVYIAKYMLPEDCKKLYGYIPGDNIKHLKKHGHGWTATGTQFAVPYVFKTLFSHERIIFDDLCETKETKTAIYLDLNEDVEERLASLEARRKKVESKIKSLDKKGQDASEYVKELEELEREIEGSHNYAFVGKCGHFCPIKAGCGGATLVRDNHGKKDSVTGAKGYHWLESEMVRQLHKEGDIDKSYYISLVDAAVDTISQYVDFEEFVADAGMAVDNAA